MNVQESVARQPESRPVTPVDRLRAYLRDLPEAAKGRLASELGKARARGEDIPGADLILSVISPEPTREVDDDVRAEVRTRALAPLAPFVIDEKLERKARGRLESRSIEAIWIAIRRDFAKDAADACDVAFANGSPAERAAALSNLWDTAVRAMGDALAGNGKNGGGDRLATLLGDPRAVEDMREARAIFVARERLAVLAARMPATTRNLGDEALDNARAAIETMAAGDVDRLALGLAFAQTRLAVPHQILRVATRVLETDDPARILPTPYRVAVDLALTDLERCQARVAAAVDRGEPAAAIAPARQFHDGARGLRTELDLGGENAWNKQLAILRGRMAKTLTAAIEAAPGRLRQLLRAPVRDNAVVDASDVEEVENALELVVACRAYAGEMAMSEAANRVFAEIQSHLEHTTTQLLELSRGVDGEDFNHRVARINAAVRFCAKIFGSSYAQLLQKAADVAIANAKAAR